MTRLDGIPHGWRELNSFTGLQRRRALVYAPRDEEDVAHIFAWARDESAHVTLRAAGHSFDDQALGAEQDGAAPPVVVSMTGFDAITIDLEARRMTVGAGATWGAILARLEPLGLVPYVTVTTAHATAGGTLSGDCLSRFSPAYGKEGRHVAELAVITPDGERRVCRPPPEGAPPRTLEERLFCGIVGGLGYLGAVTSITYDLLAVGQTAGRIGVESWVCKYDSFERLATDLVPLVKRIHERDPEAPESVFSALSSHGGKERALLIHSRYTTSPDRVRMPQHQPETVVRLIVEWLMRARSLTGVMWGFFFDVLKEGRRYIDDLDGYTFMMDGNVRAKQIAQRLGFSMKAIQQTFMVPVASDVHRWEDADTRLRDFLATASARFAERGLEPTLMDVLYIPRDDHFLLSASTGMASFAVSFAFETSDDRLLERIAECFVELSETCRDIGGRVYLVKNVCARPDTLAAMYAATVPEFFELKDEVDPRGVLRNPFLERNLGKAERHAARAAEEAPGFET
jgi:decaprenylphospho-beta-D-ribofuranose 2-oxidase